MPAIEVTQEMEINQPVAEVYGYVRIFENWPAWSPWLICERETQLDMAADQYSWDGKVIGSGKMSVVREEANRRIDYQLEFFKPWKSQADVTMEFDETSAGTRVVWTMDSKLPWFMFFMKSMMERMVGMDYQRGLTMLKDQLETGQVLSKLDYTDRLAIPSCDYIAIKRSCTMKEMPERMCEDIQKLGVAVTEKCDPAAPPFTIYDEWKLGKGMVSYTIGFPVNELPATPPSGMVTGTRPACDAFVVTHTGPYKHLGNAWSAAMMRARSKVFKQSKCPPPFELYLDNPEDTPEAELRTHICMPSQH